MQIPEILKGHSIVIGRDTNDATKLRIMLDNNKSIVTPLPSSQNVSRKHLSLTIDAVGNIVLQNIKAVRPTYVDGIQIEKKRYNEGSIVELGNDRVRLSIDKVLAYAARLQPTAPQVPVSIAHLEKVWNEYEAANDKIDNKNKLSNAFIGLGSVLVTIRFLLMNNISGGVETAFNVLLGVGALIAVYGVVKRATDKTKEKKRELQIKFEQEYVCPNPNCHHFLGYKRFTLLKQDKRCQYCHVEFKNE